MNRLGILRFALLLIPAAAGCSAPAVSFQEMAQGLLRNDIRCLVSEEDLVVLSPYPPGETARYLMSARSSIATISAALVVEVPKPIVLRMIPRPAGTLRISVVDGVMKIGGKYERPSQDGVLGVAFSGAESSLIKMYVPDMSIGSRADGQRIVGFMHSPFEGTLRHEVAHLHANRAGLDGPVWFSEGLAMTFEYCDQDAPELWPAEWPKPLQVAVEIHHEFTIADLLEWEESGEAIDAGQEPSWGAGRPLALALMLFLLEQESGESWLEGFKRVQAMDRAALLALEEPWHAWLAGKGTESVQLPPVSPSPQTAPSKRFDRDYLNPSRESGGSCTDSVTCSTQLNPSQSKS